MVLVSGTSYVSVCVDLDEDTVWLQETSLCTCDRMPYYALRLLLVAGGQQEARKNMVACTVGTLCT